MDEQAPNQASDGSGPIGRLSAGMTIIGKVRGKGTLALRGSVVGPIELDGRVEILPGGLVRGPVSARDVEVGGKLEGNLTADETVVCAEGKVEGNVKTGRMTLEDGGIIDGTLQMVVDLPEALASEVASEQVSDVSEGVSGA